MLQIPAETLKPFDALLEKKSVPQKLRPDYRKWLRYFFDFRAKYRPPGTHSEQVRIFIEKLRSKGQSPRQLEEAARAVSLFFATQAKAPSISGKPGSGGSQSFPAAPLATRKQNPREAAGDGPVVVAHTEASANGGIVSPAKDAKTSRPGRRFDEMRFRVKTKSPEWDKIIEKLEAEITTRHYSNL